MLTKNRALASGGRCSHRQHLCQEMEDNMYPQRYPSNVSQFSSQQLVSLEKHQEMIDSALCWHKYAHSVPVGQERTSVAKLRRIVATIVTIFQG